MTDGHGGMERAARGGEAALAGRIALVTGASGGIGQAIVEQLAAAGARVVAAYGKDGEAAADLLARVRAAGGEAVPAQGDLSAAAGAAAVVKTATEHFGGLDILVNNAGITKDGLVIRMKESDWDAVLDTNLKSAFLCVQAASRALLRSACGRIVNITSVAGIMGNAGQANYASAKAGMIGLTKTLAREFASRRVTVNAVAPGFIGAELRERLIQQIPLGRFGRPADVAAIVRFLAGDAGAYITGQVVQVDGGLAM
jgi:3-oxoacyl-[acyl-carrier protein] reductase